MNEKKEEKGEKVMSSRFVDEKGYVMVQLEHVVDDTTPFDTIEPH